MPEFHVTHLFQEIEELNNSLKIAYKMLQLLCAKKLSSIYLCWHHSTTEGVNPQDGSPICFPSMEATDFQEEESQSAQGYLSSICSSRFSSHYRL